MIYGGSSLTIFVFILFLSSMHKLLENKQTRANKLTKRHTIGQTEIQTKMLKPKRQIDKRTDIEADRQRDEQR